MKTQLLCAGTAALVLATPALADQFAGMYGNTVHVEHKGGPSSTVYVNADHTFEQHMADGKVVRGTYSWKDDTHFCIAVTDPKPEPGAQTAECDEIAGDHKVGDTWTVDDGQGHQTTLSITAGR